MTNQEQPTLPEADHTKLTSSAGDLAVSEAVTIDPSDGDHLPKIPEGIMTGPEISEWVVKNGYGNGKRGTYSNGESFFYKKDCHRVESEEDIVPALEAARYMTSKGMLHPATRWGVFKYDDDRDGYQLFAVSPRLQGWSLSQIETEASGRLSKPYTDEDSAKLEWLRRLDPDATVAKAELPTPAAKTTVDDNDDGFGFDDFDGDFFGYGSNYPTDKVKSTEPLAGLLNIHEASHLDNWGWDTNGKIYPIDVEVIRLNTNTDTIREWYAQQHPETA